MVDYRSMPRDIPTLKAWGAEAYRRGNEEAMKHIAIRIQQIQEYQKDLNRKYEGGESGLEKFAIGAGRGAMDLAQGAKQKALMVGEGMGLVDEGRAQEYSEEVAEEQQRFEEDFPGIGPESFGRFAAWSAPGAILPGGPIGAAVGAGVESAVMPTPDADWGQVATQAAIGTATAGALRNAPAALGAGRDALRNTRRMDIEPEMEDALRYAESQGFGVRPHHISGERGVFTELADSAPFNRSASRVRADRDAAIEQMENLYPNASVQQGAREGLEKVEMDESKLWRDLSTKIGSARFDPNLVRAMIMSEYSLLKRSGKADKGTLNALRELHDIMPTDEGFLNLKNFRSTLGRMRSGQWGERSVSQVPFNRLYGRVTEYLKSISAKGGALDEFDIANAASREKHRMLKQTRLSQPVLRDRYDSERLFENLIKGGDKDRNTALRYLLNEEGVDGAKRVITEQIVEGAKTSPRTVMKKFRKLEEILPTYMDEAEIMQLRGFSKWMEMIAPDLNTSITPREFVTRAVSNIGIPTAAVVNPATLPVLLIQQVGLPALMRRRDAREYLNRMAGLNPNSREARQIGAELNKMLNAIVYGAASEMATEDFE